MLGEILLRATNEINSIESAAAAGNLTLECAAGEVWEVHEVVIYHDDPAGNTLNWRLINPTMTKSVTIPIGAVAINERVRLGAWLATPLVLCPGMAVDIMGGALAAGKKFYMEYHIHRVRGVPAGEWL